MLHSYCVVLPTNDRFCVGLTRRKYCRPHVAIAYAFPTPAEAVLQVAAPNKADFSTREESAYFAQDVVKNCASTPSRAQDI
jgi:hypothetical protein